jgi:hypothetical protein
MGLLAPKPATSSSVNKAYDKLSTQYAPVMNQGVGAPNFMSGLLGVPGGDTAGSDAGFQKYKDQAGYAPALADMQSGVTQGAAAKGLLNSGATSKALLKGGANLNNGFFQNYFQNLSGLSGQGLQAGGLVGNAGQTSSSNGGGPSTFGNIMSGIGGIAGIFSDRRLKRDIVLLDREDDGLGLYTFRMHDEKIRRVGVMADEVRAIRPWAMGAKVGGYDTVHYGVL